MKKKKRKLKKIWIDEKTYLKLKIKSAKKQKSMVELLEEIIEKTNG